MRKNEFNSLEEFTSSYVGEWNPSIGHWFGLDFSFKGTEYRFCTGSMFCKEDVTMPDGREGVFYIYEKKSVIKPGENDYTILGEFADMEDVLKSTCIFGIPFEKVIMDDDTLLLGQD